MKSKVCLVDEKDELRNSIKLKIKDMLSLQENGPILRSDMFYDILLCAKYIVEEKNLNYSNVINGDIDKLKEYLEPMVRSFSLDQFFQYELYKLLKDVAFEDYHIFVYRDRVLDNYLKKDKKYLLIGFPAKYMINPNIDICYFSIVDSARNVRGKEEILGLDRYWYTIHSSIEKEYDEIILFIDGSINKIREKNLEYVFDKFKGKKFIIVTSYKNISKLDVFSWIRLRGISKTIIDKDRVYLKYNNYYSGNNLTMNIQNISELSDDKVSDVINTDEDIKDVSINVSIDTIRENNSRIGFSIYNKKEVSSEDFEIAKLVDENERILDRINRLGKIISEQIDKMNFK